MPLREYKSPGKLSTQITDLFRFLDQNLQTKNKLTEQQLQLITMLFIEGFPVESVEDVAVFVKNALRGEYEQGNYAGIDSPTIHRWFSQYLDTKYAERERLRERAKNARDKNETLVLPEAPASEEERAKTEELKSSFMQKLNNPTPRPRKSRHKGFANDEDYLKFKKQYEDARTKQ